MTELSKADAAKIDAAIEPRVYLRTRLLPWVCLVLMAAALITGVAGIYAGSIMQAGKNDEEVAGLRKQLADQKLEYEQRLGKQSAAYAIDATNFGLAVQKFGEAIAKMDAKNDRRAAERERAQAEAILAAQRAAAAAAAAAQKTDQILVKQDAVQQQVNESVATAKATEKKLDTAVRPTAATPPRAWGDVGGR